MRGLVGVPDAPELLRFLTVSSETATVGGREALVYSAFGVESGPWGVAWREPDGLVVQVSGLGASRRWVHPRHAEGRGSRREARVSS